MNDTIDQFRQAINNAGLSAPDVINDDGMIHRFSTNGKPRDDSGWYILHTDGVAAGVFGCWRESMQSNWCAKSDNVMTNAERDAHRRRMVSMKAQREAGAAQRHELAAIQAAQRWAKATPTTDHAYLTIKDVKGHGVRLEADGFLIVPMRDTASKLWNIERINPTDSKDKKGLYGGRRTGLYHSIGQPDGLLIVCEGYATGASIYECTGYAVAVAFNAGNLEAVSMALRGKYPELQIIIAADDDYRTEGNPGMTKAKAAALSVGGLMAVPDFGADRPVEATDFNDLHQMIGAGTVKACLDAATRAVDEWPVPTPLPNALPPVDPFDAELLPVALRAWVMDIAHRMQCPPDFPAVAVLVALSSLVGARAVIQPKAFDDWLVVPNLWGAVVGRPGVKKSPALAEALRPLNRLQSDEIELHQAEHEAWALDCKVATMQGEENERKAKGLANKDPAGARALLQPVDTPTGPTVRRYIVNDATVEKLGELMQQNPWGILSFRDELYGLLTGLDKPGQEGSRAFMLQSYDGNQGYTFDRIGRGTIHIPRVCLSMIGGIQPGRIQEYVRGAVAGGSGDDGLLQRFGLLVWPDNAGEFVHVDQWPDSPAKQTAWAVFNRLAALRPASCIFQPIVDGVSG